MTQKRNGGPDRDLGAAAHQLPLDYHDTGRQDERPRIVFQDNRRGDEELLARRMNHEIDQELDDVLTGAFAVLVEREGGMRRELTLSLAAAERAQRRAHDRGKRCRIALVRLEVIAELERPRNGGLPCHG